MLTLPAAAGDGRRRRCLAVPSTNTLSTTPSGPAAPSVAPRSTSMVFTPAPREVVDLDEVAATEGVDGHLLDTVGVHHDVADVAREQQAPAVVDGREGLVPAGAVERHQVAPGTSLDDVAAVAGIPDELVVVRAERGGVVATVAVDDVVAVDRPWKSSAPEPPSSRSSPACPLIVVGSVSVNGTATPAVSSMSTSVVTAAGADVDAVEVRLRWNVTSATPSLPRSTSIVVGRRPASAGRGPRCRLRRGRAACAPSMRALTWGCGVVGGGRAGYGDGSHAGGGEGDREGGDSAMGASIPMMHESLRWGMSVERSRVRAVRGVRLQWFDGSPPASGRCIVKECAVARRGDGLEIVWRTTVGR